MTRQEVFERVDYAIRNGKRKDNTTLLDVLFYKKGSGTLVIVVEHHAYSAFADDIHSYESNSPSEAIAKAIGRHAKPDEMTMEDNNSLGGVNARLEHL